MKLTVYVILFTALFSVSCTSKTVVLSEEQLPEDIFYLSDEIKPFTGTCYIYFENTEVVKEELNFKNGILNGKRMSYYKDGQVKRTGSYKTGEFNGVWMSFDKSGNKIYEAEYRNDTLLGKFISWYSTGVIREKGTYTNNSKVGEWVSYDEAGMLIKKVLL